jgi:N-acetylneuraminate epimerase
VVNQNISRNCNNKNQYSSMNSYQSVSRCSRMLRSLYDLLSGYYAADLKLLVVVLIVLLAPGASLTATDSLQWHKLPSLPDSEGFAGSFAGTHNAVLIVAGGANFPEKMPWEGGTKVWYDRVFMLESVDAAWQEIGRLPRPLGYGVSISTTDGIVCIGGSDANQHYQDCFRIQWRTDRLSTVLLPSLPRPCANACGAMLDNTIYVAGGLETPTATSTLKTFWSLDLSNPRAQWRELEPWPGPARMLATAAVQDNAFFLCSGADLLAGSDGKAVRTYLADAYLYRPDQGWSKIADLPRPAVAAPTPAAAIGETTFLIIGGDDGKLVDFKPPAKHPGFPKSILAYNTQSDSWQIQAAAPLALVTTTVVTWRDRFVLPGGETRPGKRSPTIWSVNQ